MSTIPLLTEQKIRTFVGEQNFLKGQQGVRDEAIVNPEQQAMALISSDRPERIISGKHAKAQGARPPGLSWIGSTSAPPVQKGSPIS